MMSEESLPFATNVTEPSALLSKSSVIVTEPFDAVIVVWADLLIIRSSSTTNEPPLEVIVTAVAFVADISSSPPPVIVKSLSVWIVSEVAEFASNPLNVLVLVFTPSDNKVSAPA